MAGSYTACLSVGSFIYKNASTFRLSREKSWRSLPLAGAAAER